MALVGWGWGAEEEQLAWSRENYGGQREEVIGVERPLQKEVSQRIWKGTALRNHNRTVFEKMTSWAALTWKKGMKSAF